ncbi:MAG TPA: V-type ATPase 116kDa subunit family protein [Spirochaetia bacterium]|nr:V-type ATPase 116kDa subunit family protein [Spirochaetia bacterium]
MIFRTAKMKHLVAVVVDADSGKVTKELLRQGVLHFVRVTDTTESWKSKIHPLTPQVSQARIGEVRRRIESFLRLGGFTPPPGDTLEVDKLVPVDVESSDGSLDKLAERIQGIREEQRRIQQEILRLEDIGRQLELFGDLGSAVRSRSQFSFLSFRTGAVSKANQGSLESALAAMPSVLMPLGGEGENSSMLLITMKREEQRIDKILEQHGWVNIELSRETIGPKEEVLGGLEKKRIGLREEQEALNGKLQEMITREKPDLESKWANLRMNELYYTIQDYFSKTSRTVIFSGWLPASKQRALEEGIRKVTQGRCYMEWTDPEGQTEEMRKGVPVLFENPKILSPFQRLVVNYAIPEYGTIDPTPFVALSYLIMFGLMFGDAGHGLVISLLGLVGALYYRGKNEGRFQLFSLIGWCGLSAIVTGVLFGAYFGMKWFPPLWFDYHGIVTGHTSHTGYVKDINGVLVITIYFGIAIIALGLLLNWINLVSKNEWRKLIFDKGGILGGWMYGAGVYVAFYFVNHDYRQLPEANLLFWLLGLPSLILLLKPPLEFAAERKKHPSKRLSPMSFVDFAMEWIVEMLEIFSGYLANTLSFMRVAGLGIAHVSLMLAFFEIAGMAASNGRFTIWSILLLIAGNVLVIGLEGLSAGIQSLRLNYYEFFSKYFSGSGRTYMPVSLSNREEAKK